MKKIFFAMLTLSLSQITIAFSQEINTDINGKKMSDFIRLETKLKGKVYQKGGDIIIPGGMEMPILYRRAQKGIPDLTINYIFTKKDSVIHEIQYCWDPRNFEDGKPAAQSIEFDKALIRKYNLVLKELTARFGASEARDDLTDLAKINTNRGLGRSDSWTTKDGTKIYMSTILANHYKFDDNDNGNSLHKIDIYVTTKRK
ncbi:hypothetical protein [Pedobacter sp. N23S346]|uniref:hypothetical protein n=1 Tax=Pedobacter sp. N23S346 TaxID=3402750 RepID=UPI003AD4739D